MASFTRVALLLVAAHFCEIAQAVNIELVRVDNPGNAPDARYNSISVGSVGHTYWIGKFEVTAGQYTEFLNAVAKTDHSDEIHRLYNINMTEVQGAQIHRTGTPGNYSYTVAPDWANRPVNNVSFWDALRFVNWLHNGQTSGPIGPETTEDGAYTLSPAALSAGTVTRNVGATFFIPTENEWYKAAYHDKSSGLGASYFDFPTGTNVEPGNDITETTNSGNNANLIISDYAIGSPYYRTEVGQFSLSESPYGTFDQGGNVAEWNETILNPFSRGVRGASYGSQFGSSLSAFHRGFSQPVIQSSSLGFRVASRVPEPTSFTMYLGAVLLFLPRTARSATF